MKVQPARIEQSALGSLWGRETQSTLVRMLTLMLKKEKFACEGLNSLLGW